MLSMYNSRGLMKVMSTQRGKVPSAPRVICTYDEEHFHDHLQAAKDQAGRCLELRKLLFMSFRHSRQVLSRTWSSYEFNCNGL